MKKKNKNLKFSMIASILILVCFFVIIIAGKTYTVNLNIKNDIQSIDKLDISIDNEESSNTQIVEIEEKKLDSGILKLKFKSLQKGKTYITIYGENQEFINLFPLYVHNFGVITYNNYFGDSNFGKVVPICITILLAYVVYNLTSIFRNGIKENLYQYRNMAYLGLIIFFTFLLIDEVFTGIIGKYDGIIHTLEQVRGVFASFSILSLPIAFVTSIFVIISNIVLIKKEGRNAKNLLGTALGVILCISALIPEIMNNFLQKSTFINVHNESGLAAYVEDFIETLIYILVTYLECILLSTVIIVIKSGRHTPNYDKDYVIILGCQIAKDGTLTPLLKARVDSAIKFSNIQKEKTGNNLVFIPSGGKGDNEVISEAQAMKNYLLEKGISENDIIIEDKSKNTYENIKFSKEIIDSKNGNPKIAFSTTNYHVFRAGNIALNQKINIEGIGSKTKLYFWINAFIREFIATIVYEKKKHIITIILVLLITIVTIVFKYIANVI